MLSNAVYSTTQQTEKDTEQSSRCYRSFPSVEGLNYLDLTFWALGGNTHWPESRGTLLYLFYAIPVIMQGKHGKSHPDKNLWSNAPTSTSVLVCTKSHGPSNTARFKSNFQTKLKTNQTNQTNSAVLMQLEICCNPARYMQAEIVDTTTSSRTISSCISDCSHSM